jgi:hypothetical protein
VVAAILFALRRRKVGARIALLPVALDLAAAYAALRATIAAYGDAGQIVAGLGLGVFVLIVVFEGLALQRPFIIAATIIAMAEETLLLHQGWRLAPAHAACLLRARPGRWSRRHRL